MAGVFTGVNIRWVVVNAMSAVLLLGSTQLGAKTLHGFNYLQVPSATLDQPSARESLLRMKNIGADSVVLVPFFRQGRPNSGEIGFSDAVTDRQLRSAIENARQLNLSVILKPQILVDTGWAGDIRFGNDIDEERWFERYRDLLTYYARLAQSERVDAFVIGTELSGIETSARWHDIVVAVRKVYRGRLTYAAHGVEGVKRFSAWKEMDAVSVNLYPSLGENNDTGAIREHMERTLTQLRESTQELARPIWVLEVGIPSAKGALNMPWDWRRLNESGARPDVLIQSAVFRQWLEALDKPWVDAVFIWCWYSDPYAGGLGNNDYTLQNKPAEKQVSCLWAGDCSGSQK
jgi:hypothetical protein